MTAASFPAAVFARRRARLMRRLPRDSAAIFGAGSEARRNGDVDHPFRQRSSFYYLTGFAEPDAVAVLRPGHEQPFTLFVRPYDPETAVWDGPRLGVEGATRELGADAAYPIGELDEQLPKLLGEARTVAFSLGSDERLERLISRIVRRAARRSAARRRGDRAADRPRTARRRAAPDQVARGDRGPAARDRRNRRGHRGGDARDPPRPPRVRGASRPRGRVPPRRIAARRLPLDRRGGRQRLHAALHRQPRADRERRPAAARCRRRDRLLRRGREPHLPPRTGASALPSATSTRWSSPPSARRSTWSRPGCASTTCTSAPQRVITEGLRDLGVIAGPPADAAQAGGEPPLLHARHLALAGDGRARRRPLPQGRRVAGAAAWAWC